MLSSAVIVFREVLEAALIVTILMAATRGLPGRNLAIIGGIAAGIAGAVVVAFSAAGINNAFNGVGQEVLNALILLTAVFMLAWHNIWMSRHGRELVAKVKNLGSEVTDGSKPLYFIGVAVSLAVLREGSEVVLFMYGIAASGSSGLTMLYGSLLGVVFGVVVGVLLYNGLLRIPTRMLFRGTGWLILLLASGLAASAAGYLSQAGILPNQLPLWNTSDLLSEKSMIGQLLHILVGYQARPTAIQLGFYIATLLLIISGMKWVESRPTKQTATA